MTVSNAKSHIKRLLEAENEGTLALEFFEHNPKAHAKKKLNHCQMKRFKIYLSIFSGILFFNWYFCFFKGFIGFLLVEIIMKFTCIHFRLVS